MQNFLFSLPARVTFGPGSIDAAGSEAAGIGSRALVVTGKTFARRSGLIGRLTDSLNRAGVAHTLFDEIDPNPRVGTIASGACMAREHGSDFVIGLGGGSVLDAAKAIALAALTQEPVWEFTAGGAGTGRPIERALPIMQIPIVASTGSETNDTAMIFNEETSAKAPIKSPHLQARVVIIDPALTFTVPPHYTAVGGMNIVSQIIEGYLTSDEFPVTDRVAEGLVRVILDSLPRAIRRGEDLDARTNLSWAAAIAPSAAMAGRSYARPLLVMAHPLTARYDIEHGLAVAALWPSYMRYVLGQRYRLPHVGRVKRYALLGRQIFGVQETDDEVAAETTAYRLTNWLRGMDMPTDLRSFDVNPDDFPGLAERAVTVSAGDTRQTGGLTAADIEKIYEGALRPA